MQMLTGAAGEDGEPVRPRHAEQLRHFFCRPRAGDRERHLVIHPELAHPLGQGGHPSGGRHQVLGPDDPLPLLQRGGEWAHTAASTSSGSTLPGFAIPSGSNTRFTRHIASMSRGA